MAITLIIGPMFSEKTNTLISHIRKFAYTKKKCAIIKHTIDTRYTTENILKSHSNDTLHPSDETDHMGEIQIMSANKLENADVDNVQVIGIDEGQFFSDLKKYVELWANNGKEIVISALDGDFHRNPFGQICDIVPLCENIIKLHGICMICKNNESSFTKKLNINDENIVDIGGKDKYISCCRKCYML